MHIYGLRGCLCSDSDLTKRRYFWTTLDDYRLWPYIHQSLPGHDGKCWLNGGLCCHIPFSNRCKSNNAKRCICLFRHCEAKSELRVPLYSCNNVKKILWTRVIIILFNLENVLHPSSSIPAARSGWMIPVGAVILWSTATPDTLKIRDYCSGIYGAATFQDINKSIPTISGPGKGSGESAACWLETGRWALMAAASIRRGVSEQLLS